jgi:hypothetical protein
LQAWEARGPIVGLAIDIMSICEKYHFNDMAGGEENSQKIRQKSLIKKLFISRPPRAAPIIPRILNTALCAEYHLSDVDGGGKRNSHLVKRKF